MFVSPSQRYKKNRRKTSLFSQKCNDRKIRGLTEKKPRTVGEMSLYSAIKSVGIVKR